MKRILPFLLFLLLNSFCFSKDLYISAGYAPQFFQIITENNLIECHVKSNGLSLKTLYQLNDKIGIDCNIFTTLAPSFTIDEYKNEIVDEKITKTLINQKKTSDFSNNIASFQLGFSFTGDCDFCFFNPQLNFDFSIINFDNQIAVYNGLIFDYSYNQLVGKIIFSLGFNAGVNFISYSKIKISDYDTNFSKNIFRMTPYITVGIRF